MSTISMSSKISSPINKFEKKSKTIKGTINKNLCSDSMSKSVLGLPRIDTTTKKTINNDVVKRWGRAERRLTLVSFPKILTERKRRHKLQEDTQAYKERENRFLKTLEGSIKSNVTLEHPDNYFNIFYPLYFGSSENTISPSIPTSQLSTRDICIDSKNYITTFNKFCNNYKNIENKREKFFDNYNVSVIRKRQFLELQKKIEKNEITTKTFLEIGENLEEHELINNFNQMTDQFASLTFKLCHFVSIKATKNSKIMANDKSVVENDIIFENAYEKKIDCQLEDIEYQINEVNKDIDKILKLLNE